MTSLGARSKTVVIVTGGLKAALPTPLVVSTAKVYDPPVVGIPDRTPDSESSASPGGKLPLATK